MPDMPQDPDQFNHLLSDMQQDAVQDATLRGFRATPEQMGLAAVAAALVAELARLTLALDLHGWDDQAQALERVLAEAAASAGVALDEDVWTAAAVAPKREGARELIALTRDAVRRAAMLLGPDPGPGLADLLDRVTPENVHAEVPVSPADPEPTLNPDGLLTYAAFVLGSVEAAREWFDAPHQLLGDQTPAEVVRTPEGAQRVKGLLDGLEWSLPL